MTTPIQPMVDPRVKALQDRMAAEGASVPVTSTVGQLEAQLKEARATLKGHNEHTAAKIKQIEDEAAVAAAPVETYIVELGRKVREAKKAKKSKSAGHSSARRLGNIGFGMQP